MKEYSHESVMADECIEYMNIDKRGTYIDCTAGGGGHSVRIYERLGDEGLLIACDQDIEACKVTKDKLAKHKRKTKFIVLQENFVNIDKVIEQYCPEGADGILIDLGVSSYQLDNRERGFSYHNDGPLDMRMDQTKDKTAEHVVNNYTKDELVRIFYEYGEEKHSRRIAEAIVHKRKEHRITTTGMLTDIIKQAYPPKERFAGKHPARKTFQAIRIEVNDELNVLKEMLPKAAFALKKNGRLAVITFHSLEDRIVKDTFNELVNPCTCPKSFPVCVCNKKAQHKLVLKKPMVPKTEEMESNYRSRSSKLRVLERT
jgi:16S rRNA (cytosine1402-N4)-methyltransferase